MFTGKKTNEVKKLNKSDYLASKSFKDSFNEYLEKCNKVISGNLKKKGS